MNNNDSKFLRKFNDDDLNLNDEEFNELCSLEYKDPSELSAVEVSRIIELDNGHKEFYEKLL